MAIQLNALCLLLFGFVASAISAASEPPKKERSFPEPLAISYTYNTSDPVHEVRSRYTGALLELVLKKSGRPYDLEITTVKTTPELRTLGRLNHGRFTVSAIHTNDTFEHNLRAIRYPIFRGLTGWRLFFIRESEQFLFSPKTSLQQLQQMRAGQGHNWSDNAILLHNKFTLRTYVGRDSLFKQLVLERIDYFPRGLYEIWPEKDVLKPEGLIVDKHFALRYPTATYMFVAKNQGELAQVLETGFEKAITDGSFNDFFWQHMGEAIKRAKLLERRIIELTNPTMPGTMPVHRPELWFSLDELKHRLQN